MGMTNKKNIDVATDFISDEERAYYTKKLKEAEQHNMIHPQIWASEEFYKRKKEKYDL